jgi:hypothetical protein
MHLLKWEIFSTGIHNSEDSAGLRLCVFWREQCQLYCRRVAQVGGFSAVKKLMKKWVVLISF